MPGVVESMGATASQRRALFYGVCIPFRLLLAVFVRYQVWSRPFLLMVAAAAVYTNLLGLNTSSGVWWSRGFHMLTSLAAFLFLVGGRPDVVPVVMILDVLVGLFTSFARDPWTLK